MGTENDIDNAVFAYADACANLWQQIQKSPSKFPGSVISCGTIGEYYSYMYLRFTFKDSIIHFGRANENGWDIAVEGSGGAVVKYQIKSVSCFNKARVASGIGRDFDKLLVLSLDGTFFPTNVYLFDDATVFWKTKRIRTLTVPNLSHGLPGSKIFENAININDDFFDSLM